MALTTSISKYELARQAAAAFEGQTYTVFLATRGQGMDENSLAADWTAVKASGGGYADVTGTLATGSYSGTNARYELPAITAVFTATQAPGITYDTICLLIGSSTYLHSTLSEPASVALAIGQSKTYTFVIALDD